jgi:hypothetical protein
VSRVECGTPARARRRAANGDDSDERARR